MKKINLLLTIVLLTFASCGVTRGYLGNENQTSVILSQNNYKVVKNAQGDATGTVILGFAVNQKDLYNQAKKELVSNSDMIGTSRALVNYTIDENVKGSFLWIVKKKTITMSAQVIEFY